jgi:uncharacterized protein YecE (DUF72 family)
MTTIHSRVSPSSRHPANGRIIVGPAGWSYADWAGIVYPAPRPHHFHEATYLAQYFDTIEINTSFYQPLHPDHARQWVQRVEANPRFVFTAKLWKKFTHQAGATPPDEKLDEKPDEKPDEKDEKLVRDGFAPLVAADKLACVLAQFPHSFHQTPENIKLMESLFERFGDYPLVVEVRHRSWEDPEFFAMLKARGVGFCNIDQPVIGRAIPPSEQVTGPIAYVRLHGRRYDTWFNDDPTISPHERYNYLYSAAELTPWAERIQHLARQARSIFVIANNHFQGKAVVNALQLIHLLSGAKVRVPEPLRHRYPELESIADAPAQEPTLFS